MGSRYALAALVMALGAGRAATLTVSPGGEIPSLAAARDAVRAMRSAGKSEPVSIVVRGGLYQLGETLVLDARESDTTWSGSPGEHAIISGGRRIEGWTKGKGPVWTAPARGPIRQLFVNSRRATRARTPNYGFYRIAGDSSQDKPFLLRYRGNDILPAWAGSGAEVIALLAWAEIRMPIVSVDEGAHLARLTGDPRSSNKEADARYWIENAPGTLDMAGEWYYDHQAGTISYWPVAGENMSKAEVVAPALEELVRIAGGHDIVFRGLDFRHAGWSIPAAGYADTQAANAAPIALEVTGAEKIAIDHCVFTQSGGYAIGFGRGARHNRITGNHIFDLGGGGLKIGETVQRPAEADQNFDNLIADNDIHDLGAVFPAAVGIWVAQSGRNTISHNHVHDLYYTAISVGWTWGYGPNQSKGNIIEYNHLHDIGKSMLSDMGAIYTLGIQPGTVLRNNLIHDVNSFTYGGWGIYPDEGSSEMLIENNVVYRTKSAGFHQHYGRENVVRNNIFAFGREYQLMRSRVEPHVSFIFEGNIVYYDSGHLLGGNWTGDHYRMRHNLYWDARGEAVGTAGNDSDSRVADPLFVNAGSYDFRLKPGSPALAMGFHPIEVSGVGPRAPAGIPDTRQ